MDKKTNVKVMNGMAEKIETLDNRIKTLEKINLLNAERNNTNMKHFESFDKRCNDLFKLCELADKRINKVFEMVENINERYNISTNFEEKILNCLEIIDERIHHLKSDIKELAKNDLDLEEKINTLDSICVEQYDVLEAKNFVVKRDVDTVIEEHEMFLKQLEDKFINNNKGDNNE